MARVFISSVMDGFSEERSITRQTVEGLGHEPVMAELFGARPQSPRSACLDGVRASDWFIGILGERYGFPTDSGLSPTEEEFRAAEQRDMPIALFLKDGKRDSRQDKFIKSIGGFESGYFYKQFKDAAALGPAVAQALRTLEQNTVATTGVRESETRLRELLNANDTRFGRGEPHLAVALLPLEAKDFLDVALIGTRDFREHLLQAALFGPTRLFSPERGTRYDDAREHLALVQDSATGAPATFRVHLDGAMLFDLPLTDPGPDNRRMGFFGSVFISEESLSEVVRATLAYASAFYGQVIPPPRPSRVALHCALKNGSGRRLGRRPREAVTSYSHLIRSVDDPLFAPVKPISLRVTDLAHRATSEKVIAHFTRAFQVAGAYGTSSQ